MASFVSLQTVTDSQGADSSEDRISMSMLDMQETRQIGFIRQHKQRRAGGKKTKKNRGDRLMM